MADATATVALNIETTGIEESGRSLEQLRAKLTQDTAALREMQAAMRNLRGSGAMNVEAFRALQQRIQDQRTVIAATQAQYVRLGGTFGQVREQAGAVGASANGLDQLQQTAQLLPGPLGAAAGKAGALGQAFSKLAALGPVALAVAAVAVLVAGVAAATVAMVGAVAATLKWGVALANTNRAMALTVAGIEASNARFAGLSKILPGIENATGMARDELAKMGSELMMAGARAKGLPTALRAMAIATKGGATEDFLARLKYGLISLGKVPPELAKQFRQFESIAAAKMLDLDEQAATFKRNVGKLFGSLKIEGFLAALGKLGALFDESSASGKTLRFLFQTMFQPMVDALTALAPLVRRVFMLTLINILKAYIALKPFSDELALLAKVVAGSLVLAFVLLGAVIFLALVPILALVAAVGIVLAAVVAAGMLMAAIWDGVAGAARAAWADIVEAWGAAGEWFTGLGSQISSGLTLAFAGIGEALANAKSMFDAVSWSEIGTFIVSGIADGITGAAGKVIGALKGVVTSAVGGVKSLLKIQSPSKVFAEIGGNTAAGFAQGIDDGVPLVQASATSMAGGAAGAASAAASTGAGAARGGASFAPGSIVFNVTGGDASEIAQRCRAELVAYFEEVGLMLGAPEPGVS